MKNERMRNAIGLYLAGCGLCTLSVLLMLFWQQGGITVPPMIRNVVGGLPWISVAAVIVVWRAKELPKLYPLAFVFGVGSPFLVLFLLSWL